MFHLNNKFYCLTQGAQSSRQRSTLRKGHQEWEGSLGMSGRKFGRHPSASSAEVPMSWHETMIEKAKGFIMDGRSLVPALQMIKGDRMATINLRETMDNKRFLLLILKVIVHDYD